MNLEDTITALVGREGGYSNNPNDSGGDTMWGITVQVARAFGYSGPMNLMPRETAVLIYKQRYWFGPKLDQVNSANNKTAEKMLDIGVNMGTSVAVKFLQRALNVLNRGAKIYPDIVADGNIGPMTLSVLKSFLGNRGLQGETVLIRLLNDQQGVRYMEIAEGDPKDEEFVFGWILNRVF